MVKEDVKSKATDGKSAKVSKEQSSKANDVSTNKAAADKTVESTNEFGFIPTTPAEQEERRRKLWQIGLVLGGMLVAIIVLVVSLVAYSVGYNLANSNSSADDDNVINVNQSSDSSTEVDIPDEALAYQSQDMVGEGQIPDHYRGAGDNAQITVVEYADYSCSHCINLASHINELYDKYGDKVRFIYRHYNVGFTYSGVTAKLAEAAYVAGGEDAYWKMQDKIFGDSEWVQGSYMDDAALDDKIRSYAGDVGVDGQALVDAYHDSANNGIDAKIARDDELASQANVTGTPTVFIGKESVSGTADAISQKLDELLG